MYRRMSWEQGAVRLRVILGESGTHVDRQVLAWMFVIRLFFWYIPVGRVMHVVTESRAQMELTFYLPKLATRLVRVMEVGWNRTGWRLFNPQVTILRDPDFCVTNRVRQPLSLRLFGDGSTREYLEPFQVPEEVRVEEEKPATSPTQSAAVPSTEPAPHSRVWWLKLVVDNAPVPEREPREVAEVPTWLQAVGDTKTLYEGEDTDPFGLEVTSGTPEYLRPHPVRR